MRALHLLVGLSCACGARSAADSIYEDTPSSGTGGAATGAGGASSGGAANGGAANGGASVRGGASGFGGASSGGATGSGGKGSGGSAANDKTACVSVCSSIFSACPVPNSDTTRCAIGCAGDLGQLNGRCHELQRAALACIDDALGSPSASCATFTTALTSSCRSELARAATCR